MYAFGESYTEAKNIPVPIRKWLIQRFNKQKESEMKDGDLNKDPSQPLTRAEKEKILARQNTGKIDPKNFLTPRR